LAEPWRYSSDGISIALRVTPRGGRDDIDGIETLANGRSVDYKGSQLRFPWSVGSKLEVWIAAYGPKALALTGEVGDGFILQLADLSIAEWTIAAVRKAAADAGRDPSDVSICVAPVDVGQRLTVSVEHLVTAGHLLDSPNTHLRGLS